MKNLLFVLVALVALIFVMAAPLRETTAEARSDDTPVPAAAAAPTPPTLVARTAR